MSVVALEKKRNSFEISGLTDTDFASIMRVA
jgi:hypothetical protein